MSETLPTIDWEAYENMGEKPDPELLQALDGWLHRKGWTEEAIEIANEIMEEVHDNT